MTNHDKLVGDWWKPDPEDPFWMLEKSDGSWLKNKDTRLTTRDPTKAIRYPSRQHADIARLALLSPGWLEFSPTEHLWIALATKEQPHDQP